MKIPTSECEHCVEKVIYESPRCKLQQTKDGKVWILFGDCTFLQAVNEYRAWKQEELERQEFIAQKDKR